jgi:hypothetical protein
VRLFIIPVIFNIYLNYFNIKGQKEERMINKRGAKGMQEGGGKQINV